MQDIHYKWFILFNLWNQSLAVKCEGPADWPGLFVTYCFNYTPWRETTMPTFKKIYVVWLV
jgi:hypothetical protein